MLIGTKNIMTYKIAIIGLGYVGLPLAVSLAEHYHVIGFDIKTSRIHELKNGHDITCEVSDGELQKSSLTVTDQCDDITGHDIYIITVPTPVDPNCQPDLTPVIKASEMVGELIQKNNIIVYESTVYPGVTEDICAPILEQKSGLKSGKDFFLGYSPERVNPGDKKHTIKTLTKVVSGQTEDIANLLCEIYGKTNNNNIFKAKNIKTAEAAKVIENAQRDINIAFMNEISMIFNKMGLSAHDVLDAAKTKWNFLPFTPGLVGGHCIGVDPYYLAYLAKKLNHHPEVILAGRQINERMSQYIAHQIEAKRSELMPSKQDKHILILGVTFKEDIPDIRNSKVVDFVACLKSLGYKVDVHDPHACPQETKEHLNIDLLSSLDGLSKKYDVIAAMVKHKIYYELSLDFFETYMSPRGLLADFQKIWPDMAEKKHLNYWTI